jgi:superfamily II DNA/RNA helicase
VSRSFEEFGFRAEILQAVRDAGYDSCTPIQEKAMGPIMEGRDLTGMAETGSGKTAAFLLPILDRIRLGGDDPRALVVAPTRELALQVASEAEKLGKHRGARIIAVYGGTGLGSQKTQLLAGVDLVVGTPGRLIDFIRQTYLRLSSIRHLVLDEADRMLDMGFIKDIEFIMSKAPMSRQTMLFSATLPAEILRLAQQFMFEPVQVEAEQPTMTARGIAHSVYMADGLPQKLRLLREILRREDPGQALVFVATREMTSEVAEALRRAGISAASISSLLSQTNRERVMGGFRNGIYPVLVATDVAGRGLDIESVSHVFNFDAPGPSAAEADRGPSGLLPPAGERSRCRARRAGRKGTARPQEGRRGGEAPGGPAAAGWPAQPGVRLQERLSRREDGKLAASERRERRAANRREDRVETPEAAGETWFPGSTACPGRAVKRAEARETHDCQRFRCLTPLWTHDIQMPP